MSVTKIVPRCVARCADGSQCGRRVKDGTLSVCHIHQRQAAGLPQAGQLFAPQHDTDDPLVLLRRLMKDKDPTVRLRAIDQILKLEEKRKVDTSDRDEVANIPDAMRRLTFAQRIELRQLLLAVKQLRTIASTQALTYDDENQVYLDEPQEPEHATVQPDHQPPGQSADSAAPTCEQPDDRVAEAAPVQVAPELFEELGLFEENGTVTHALGDDHAQQILTGVISLDDARRQHTESSKKLDRMGL